MTSTLDHAAPAPTLDRHEARRPWLLLTVALTVVAAAGAVVVNRRFYFYDDTQIGAFWNWYELGTSIRDGRWPMLDPSRWMGGNIGAEGQWGVWNPLVILIGLAASVASDAAVFSTVVKVVFLAVAAAGTHVLVRDRGVPEPMAVLAGVATPLAGFTVYMDSPSWVTGLMTWALLPWAWVSLSRLADGRGGIAWAFVTSYLIVSIGYVHATVMLAVVFVAVLAGAPHQRRDTRAARRVLGCGALVALVVITVYLPQAASADVTVRAQRGITNGDFLSPDLGALVSSVSTEALSVVPGWWGPMYAPVPMMYVAWFLPVLAFVDWSVARRVLRRHVDVLVVLGAALAYVLGPSDIGPLRFPVRLMPYVALTAIALVVILLTQAPARPISRSRLGLALAWVAAAAFLAWSGRPPTWEVLALGTVLTTGALVATRWALGGGSRGAVDWPRVGVVMVAGTFALSGVQRIVHDASPLPDFGLPGDVDRLEAVPAGAVDDAVVVGSVSAHVPDDAVWDEALLGSTWYASPVSVQNVYTPVSFARYAETMCMNWRGETCAELLDRLFAAQPTTGLPLVDQLSVNSIIIVKAEVGQRWSLPPDGWTVSHEGVSTATWTRDDRVARAGGVVWQTDGLVVTELARSDTSVSLRVDGVPDGGGRAVLSRLAWPGYTATNAVVGDRVDGYLLAIDVPASSAGSVVEVTFRPPGWRVELAALAVALAGFAAWVVADVLRRRRGSPPSGVATAAHDPVER